MKSTEPFDMAQFTALATSLSHSANNKPVKYGLALIVVFVGLYLYLVPNSITVSIRSECTRVM